jgi:hypothetical protein
MSECNIVRIFGTRFSLSGNTCIQRLVKLTELLLTETLVKIVCQGGNLRECPMWLEKLKIVLFCCWINCVGKKKYQ